MANISVRGEIGASVEAVWETVSDFNSLPSYVPGIVESAVAGAGVGAIRNITLGDGAKLVERLESQDDGARTLSYAITDSPLPLESYVGTMKVRDLGGVRCEFEWSATFEPKGAPEEELKKNLAGLFESGCEGLRKLHGG